MTDSDLSHSDQALRSDPPPQPGVPMGVLVIGAMGWLLAAIAVVALPWPLPGAQPTIPGALLSRLTATVPGEGFVEALGRHALDVLPFAALIITPICLVLAAGRRQSRIGTRGLAAIGLLGLLYALGMALYVGGACAAIGFVVVLTSGLISLSSRVPDRSPETLTPPLPLPQVEGEADVPLSGETPMFVANVDVDRAIDTMPDTLPETPLELPPAESSAANPITESATESETGDQDASLHPSS